MRAFFAMLIFLGVAGGVGAQGRLGVEAVRREIEASHRMYFQALSRGDSALFAGVYSKDCWIMPFNGSTLCGEDAPFDFFADAYHRLGVRGGRLMTADIYGDGAAFVTEVGFYQWVDGSGKIIGGGTYLVLWRRMGRGWKRFRECYGVD